MYKIRRPIKDSTIYAYAPTQNAGLDPIIEVGKYYDDNDNLRLNRGLVHFDLSDINYVESSEMILRVDESHEMPLSYTIYAYPISGSWEMGTGTYSDGITTNGVNWETRNGSSSWADGGEWHDSLVASQSFEYETGDIQMNVLNIVQNWISGTIDNNGFIIKYSESAESDSLDYGLLQFFSKETHTIHSPMLRIGVDDFVYLTGSRANLNSVSKLSVIPKLYDEYQVNTIHRIYVTGRELYPTKTFDRYVYQSELPLPKETYYQITDYATGTVIIPFGEYSKVSFDSLVGSYIKLDFTDWVADRTYEIKFKVIRNEFTEYFSDRYLFKIVR